MLRQNSHRPTTQRPHHGLYWTSAQCDMHLGGPWYEPNSYLPDWTLTRSIPRPPPPSRFQQGTKSRRSSSRDVGSCESCLSPSMYDNELTWVGESIKKTCAWRVGSQCCRHPYSWRCAEQSWSHRCSSGHDACTIAEQILRRSCCVNGHSDYDRKQRSSS